MIVRFNGMYQKTKPSGCGCGGNRKGGKIAFVSRRTLTMPGSGRTMTFHLGETYEVSDEDGRFLLGYTFTNSDGAIFNAFSRVE